jgi:hypothetical protein
VADELVQAIFPGAVVDSTVFVGVYGSLRVHPWIELETMPEDAYSLLMSRAEAMRWTHFGTENSMGVPIWGMNEAEMDPPGDDPEARLAWFQVVAPSGRSENRPLPVMPLLACVNDALRRVGELDLHALQLFLPFHDSGSALSNLVSGLNWFEICDPSAKASVRITVDGGDGNAIDHRAAEILARLQQINTGAFAFDSVSIDDSMAVDPVPTIVDEYWFVKGHPRVTLVATTPEWSVDALGWTVALVAEVCRSSDAAPAILISIGRD